MHLNVAVMTMDKKNKFNGNHFCAMEARRGRTCSSPAKDAAVINKNEKVFYKSGGRALNQ